MRRGAPSLSRGLSGADPPPGRRTVVTFLAQAHTRAPTKPRTTSGPLSGRRKTPEAQLMAADGASNQRRARPEPPAKSLNEGEEGAGHDEEEEGLRGSHGLRGASGGPDH